MAAADGLYASTALRMPEVNNMLHVLQGLQGREEGAVGGAARNEFPLLQDTRQSSETQLESRDH
uniref:Uncharacterized protein n=1 Tax=Pristionchus pacificus TaxID=54126 RepID=A0A2A6CBV9_PRIPA|eukprot:PDM75587.1 hypothetical protein PRIPAC_42764 [Pristionchus pacificus]